MTNETMEQNVPGRQGPERTAARGGALDSQGKSGWAEPRGCGSVNASVSQGGLGNPIPALP